MSRKSTPCKVTAVPAVRSPRPRGRRAARPSGDDREAAILGTLEQMLEQRPLSEISVDDLARGAGLSRPTFYFYFASKEAVLVRLFERAIASADPGLHQHAEALSANPERAWHDGIYAFFDALRPNRAVLLAGLGATAGNPELREMWSTFMAAWIDYTAGLITKERQRGAAPDTIPARDLATALNLMNERVVFASQGVEEPTLPERAALEALAHIWVASIYGSGSQTTLVPVSTT
ncbi:TetR family transcriptional regulator [Mycolicibacterium litorale]|nr:TetR family transcriptional regulator [Mycolicibacterium litorale]